VESALYFKILPRLSGALTYEEPLTTEQRRGACAACGRGACARRTLRV